MELARYGIDVLSGWMRRGVIFARMTEKNLGGLPPPPDGAFLNRDTVGELAGESVAAALKYFHDRALVGRAWDSTRGASLNTYFVGACLIQYANVYRYWRRHEGYPETALEPFELAGVADLFGAPARPEMPQQVGPICGDPKK